MRLDKFLSNMNVGSRKDVARICASGVVTVNGEIVRKADTHIKENTDIIEVSGRRIGYKPFVYIMMNKPSGVLSATEDSHGEQVATDLLGDEYSKYKIGPCGRLDKDAEGFLLLTNDGDLVHRIISPDKHVDKTYFVTLRDAYDSKYEDAFTSGIKLRDGTEYMPGKCWQGEHECEAWVTISEGKFHQVKNMFAVVGNEVTYLKRYEIAGVRLDESLRVGEYRELTDDELSLLVKAAGRS